MGSRAILVFLLTGFISCGSENLKTDGINDDGPGVIAADKDSGRAPEDGPGNPASSSPYGDTVPQTLEVAPTDPEALAPHWYNPGKIIGWDGVERTPTVEPFYDFSFPWVEKFVLRQFPRLDAAGKLVQNSSFSYIGGLESGTWLYVISQTGDHGWLDLENHRDLLNNAYYREYRKQNGSNSRVSYELSLLGKTNGDSEKVKRFGPVLRLITGAGPLNLLDWEDYAAYNLAQSVVPGHLLLLKSFYEGGNQVLVNMATGGISKNFNGEPYLSPSGKYCITVGSFYVEPPTVYIFEISQDSAPELVYEKSLEDYVIDDWPDSVNWTGEDSAEVLFTGAGEPIKVKIAKKAASWSIEGPKNPQESED